MKANVGVYLVVFGLVFVAACSGSRNTVDTGPNDVDEGTEEPINLAAYEDFDPAPYEDEPPPPVNLQHDVPAELMDGTVERGGTRTVQGFRIQVFFTQDKAAADDMVEDVTGWWRQQEQDGSFEGVYENQVADPPVYLLYKQPYYRIRVGNFTSRQQAQSVLHMMEPRFPDAFIAPDQVTVPR